MSSIKVFLLVLFVSISTHAQTPPGNHITLNGTSQYLSGTTPTGSRAFREVSSRMTSARINFATDQVLFDWTGIGTLYIKAVSSGVTNLQFIPTTGTGTTTVNISAFTSGFIYRFHFDDIGPNNAYILEAWDYRGDPKTMVYSIVTASASSLDPNNKAFRIGAKLDGTLFLQADIDFWRWHDQWTPFFLQVGEPGNQSPYPTFRDNWQPCWLINGNENWVDYQFENNLSNSGFLSIVLTPTGSPIFGANFNTKPTAFGEDVTNAAKGRIPLYGTRSYDYDSTGMIPTNLSTTLSSNWTCISAPISCGSLTIRQPSKLFSWVDGATAAGTYTFTFGVTDGSLTDTDTVTVQVVNLTANLPNAACFVNEPCFLDASISTGWDSLLIDTGETIPGSTTNYKMKIPKGVHRYHTVGTFIATVTASDAQNAPAIATNTATITVTSRIEATIANTEDLTNPTNANYISPANCLGNPTGNTTKIQAALDIAKNRNTVPQKVIVPAGCRADGQLFLKVPISTEMITLQSSGALPSNHVRINPTDESQLFTIRTTLINEPAVRTNTTSHHYKLHGLVFETTVDQFAIVTLGDPALEDTIGEFSHNIIIQHCIVRTTNEFSTNIQNGIMNNANDVSIIDSYIDKMSNSNSEGHNILTYSCEGRHVIDNNYLGGNTINYFIGGAASTVRGLVPSYIEFNENYSYKPPEWQPSNPLWDHKNRGMKNHWETKNGSYISVHGNILENNWTDGQQGIAMFVQGTCDSGNWAQTFFIDWSSNNIINSEQGVEFRSSEYAGITQSRKVWYENNLIDASFRTYLFLQSSDIKINHCTSQPNSSTSAVMDGEMKDPAMIYENSIAFEGSFGWFGSGFGIGLSGLNVYWPGFIFRDSLQIGGNLSSYGSPISGMQFPVDQTSVGFTDTINNNWSLSASSPYKGDANDGTDPGVNWMTLQANINKTITGQWGNPTKCNWHTSSVCN